MFYQYRKHSNFLQENKNNFQFEDFFEKTYSEIKLITCKNGLPNCTESWSVNKVNKNYKISTIKGYSLIKRSEEVCALNEVLT